jgi:propanol-preferring alcohol dehydrogenase
MGGTLQDVIDVLEMMDKGQVNPMITTITFDQIPEGVQMLEDNKVTGRLVALYD